MAGSEKPRLGAATRYPRQYDPQLLVSIAREQGRAVLSPSALAPYGVDLWTAYELSWLDPAGKPRVAVGEFTVASDSDAIVESKSLKLYLNSLNQTVFDSQASLVATLEKDLGRAFGGPLEISLWPPDDYGRKGLALPPGICLDELAVTCEHYRPEPSLLSMDCGRVVEETLHSHLFKTNCPVTGQPDWATVIIAYKGPALDRAGLLRYLVSFRGHQGFHENAIEQLFADILERCQPVSLSIHGRYTRRGGLDINPYRSSEPGAPSWRRLARQ